MRFINTLIKKVDDFIFSHIGKTKILFLVKNNYGWTCQKPLYEALLKVNKNSILDLSICIEDQNLSISDLEIKSHLYKNNFNIKTAVWKKWHYIIHTDINSPYFHRNRVNIMMPHGTGFGNVERNYNQIQYSSSLCDIYFGLSNNEYEYIQTDLKNDNTINNKLFIPVGSPKSDALFNPLNNTTSNYLNFEKIDRKKKTILVWSHWTNTSLFGTMEKDFIETIVDKYYETYNFIITGHALLWSEHGDKESKPTLWDDLKNIENSYNNVSVTRYVPDLYPLIKLSDIFISDHSSFTIECSAKDGPILFYDDPERTFDSKQVLNAYREACYSFRNTEELMQHLDEISNGKDSKSKKRVGFKNMFYSNHGHAADFAASIIMKLGKLSPSTPEKWKKIARTKGITFSE